VLAVLSVLVLAGASRAGAQALPASRADVNRDCSVTAADVSLVQASVGRRCGESGFDANADANLDCQVNNTDLTFVVRNVGRQVCTTPPPPPPVPTIVATVSPAANTAGWHRSDVSVSFTCTNVATCPAPVTVTTEGAGQVIARSAIGAGGTVSAQVTLNIDKTAPRLSATWPASVLPGQSITVPVEASDANGVVRTSLYQGTTLLDEASARPFALERTVPQNAQVGTPDVLEVYAQDVAGNTAALRRLVPIQVPDETSPDVRLSVPPTAPPGASIPLAVAASDDRELARVLLTRLDGAIGTPLADRTSGPFAFQHVAQVPADAIDGTVITFSALATDATGNTSTATATLMVETSVETQTLRISVNPPVSPTFQGTAIVTGTIGRAADQAPPAAPPIVAGLTPATGRQGQAVDVTVTGINTTFSPSSLITFGPGVTVQSTTAASPTSLKVRVAIAPDAGLGPRLVAVQSGRQEALLGSAFSVLPGLGTITGRLLGANGQPLAGARVCLPGGTSCVTTNAQGQFTFTDASADATSVVASADGYESTTLRLKLDTGGTSRLGEVAMAVSNLPPPPPIPNAPPVSPQLAVALGRGATEVTTGGSPAALEKLVRDTIVAVGGSEIGVLDAEGRQLNPRMVGAGLMSFTPEAVASVAEDLIGGDTIGLAEFLKITMGSLTFPQGVAKPTLLQLIRGLQLVVDDAWANPGRPESALVMVLFNQGRVASVAPPRVNFDTRFNALQRDLLVSSFFAFMATTLPGTQPVALNDGATGPWTAGRPTLAYRPSPGPELDLPSTQWRPSVLRSGLGRAFERQLLLPGEQPAKDKLDSSATIMWSTLMEKSLPQTGWAAAQKGAGLCDQFLVKLASLPAPLPGNTPAGKQAATDPLAQFLPAPGCKDVIALTEMLLATKPDYGKVGGALTSFLTSEKITRFNAARVMSTFDSDAFQDTYRKMRTEVMQQSRTLEQAKKLLNFTSGLVESSLSKFQGTAVTAIFKLEAQLIIDALRPRAPFIRKVEQITDKSTNPPQPSPLVKVFFDRSPNDHGNVESVLWKYYLIRGTSGSETPVAMRVFPPGVPTEFSDAVPGEGTYYYRIRALRTVGTAVIPSHQQSGMDEIYSFLSGIVPSAGSKTPAGNQMLGIDFVKTLTDPLADIYRGVHVQASDATPPAPINVILRTVTRPPANLAIDPHARLAYLSIPSLNNIFRGPDVFAAHNFMAPGAAGLAIDSRGFLYTDNSASDARFGGRIFSFDRETGQRTHVGNTNYYSFLLQNAHPVSVQSLLVASSPRGEALYIADATSQRITLLTLPWRWAPGVTAPRNTSQPYITSPQFNFGGSTTMAMRADDTLAITQYDNVLMVAPGGKRVDPIFRAGESPFTDLTGVTFDRYLNMYVTDATAGTITMIPLMNQSAYFGFFGMDDVQKRRLTVLRGARRPADVKLRVGGDGLAFYDGERAMVNIGFGVSGRITRADGSSLAGATVLLPEVNRVAVSDGDGIFVLSNLLAHDQSPIFDVVVRAEGRTQSYVAPLDPFKHNLVDFVFDPPSPVPPPPPGDNPPPPPPPPGDRTRVDVEPPDITTPETVSTRVDIVRAGDPPAEPPPPPGDAPDACARAVFVRPGMGAGLATATPLVAGWFTAPGIPDPVLVVNGTAQPIVTATQDFTLQPTLLVGQNTLYVAVRGRWLKGEGCAAPDVDDEALISISTTLTVFHDVDPAALAQYRAGANFDLSIRGIIRDNGKPLAGIAVEVPGTSHQSWSDVDGVFQIDVSRATMAGRAAGVDALSSAMYARAGAIVALIANDQRAASIAAVEALIAQAASVSTTPPSAGSAAETVVDLAVQAEAIASRLLLALQSTEGIADEADVDALRALGQQLAGATSNGEIVIRGREYPTLTLKVKVQ
jgi:hypothetical protein